MADNQNYPIPSGAPDSAGEPLTATETSELLHCRLERIRLLRKERDPLIQAELYSQLQYFSRRLPDAIGAVEPLQAYVPALEYDAELLLHFWHAIDQLQAQGQAINHSCAPSRLALHLNTLAPLLAAAPFRLGLDGELRRALKASESPAFLGIGKVHSAITRKSAHCWIFRRVAD